MTDRAVKPVVWMGDALRVLRTFPATVQDEVGYALYLAQRGEKHVSAKPLKGFSSGVLEVVSDHRGRMRGGIGRNLGVSHGCFRHSEIPLPFTTDAQHPLGQCDSET